MALRFVGSRLVILCVVCWVHLQVVSVLATNELPGNCPLKPHLSCGTGILENGATVALELKLLTNDDMFYLPELEGVTQRLTCKLPDCLSTPCRNGGTCTETLEGFACTCNADYYGPICDWTCPESWLYFQGSCYGYFSSKRTFNQALANCRGINHETGQADLVSIHSQAEEEYIMDFPSVAPYIWIGLYQPNQGLTEPFVWSDGTPVIYTSWNPPEPDYTNANQNCICLHTDHLNTWHDLTCDDHTRAYMCKIVFPL